MSESFRSRFFGGMKAYEEFEMCFDVLSPSVYESRVILFDSLKIKLLCQTKKSKENWPMSGVLLNVCRS